MASLFGAVLGLGGTDPLVFGIVEILLLTVGVSLVWRYSPQTRAEQRATAVAAVLIAFVLLQLIPFPHSPANIFAGAPWAPAGSVRPISVAPALTRNAGLQWMAYACAFFAAVWLSRDLRVLRRVLLVLVTLGTIEAVVGIAQFLTGWQPWTGVVTIPGAWPVGSYINRDHFAGLLEMILPLAAAFLAARFELLRREQSRSSLWYSASLGTFFVWLTLTLLLVAGLLASLSRMGIIAGLISTGIVLTIFALRPPRMALAGLLAGSIAGVALLAFWLGAAPLVARYSEPVTGRLGIWNASIALIASAPLAGVGLGAFEPAITPWQQVYPNRLLDHAHNDYLELTAEIGIPAACLLFVTLGRLWRKTLRAARHAAPGVQQIAACGACGALTAILLHSVTDFNLHIPANALVFAVICGIAVGASPRQLPPQWCAL